MTADYKLLAVEFDALSWRNKEPPAPYPLQGSGCRKGKWSCQTSGDKLFEEFTQATRLEAMALRLEAIATS